MGSNNGKELDKRQAMTDVDMDFLREHTSITKNDLAMYDNFMANHPDGNIARKDFRSNILPISFHLNRNVCL